MLISLQADDRGASNVRIVFMSSGNTAATLSGMLALPPHAPNLTRVMNIIGICPLMAAIRA